MELWKCIFWVRRYFGDKSYTVKKLIVFYIDQWNQKRYWLKWPLPIPTPPTPPKKKITKKAKHGRICLKVHASFREKLVFVTMTYWLWSDQNSSPWTSIKTYFVPVQHLKHDPVGILIMFWSSHCCKVFKSWLIDRRYTSLVYFYWCVKLSSRFSEWSILKDEVIPPRKRSKLWYMHGVRV